MSDEPTRQSPLSVTPPSEPRTAGEESLPDPSGFAEKPGSPVPRYRILGPIGMGGMGVVYRAEDTRLRRIVALKFLPPTLTPNPREKARFLNEARAASALDHPNICTIYEVGETAEGQLYLAMAYYQGATLKQRLERGPLPTAEALQITLQGARGLAKAHHQGIVHRDIKPGNLMITADGIVKILDFGIARLSDQTLTGPVLGTPGYMSPEQARVGVVDARSDVWSLGVVLREMLTGWHPGQSERAEALPRQAPPGLDGLLARMLAEELADRYPDAAALLADLSKVERAAAAAAEGRLAPRPARRRPPAWTVALAVAAVLAAAAGAWLLGVRPHDGAGTASSAAPSIGATDLPGEGQFFQLTDLPGKEWFPSLTPDASLVVYAKQVDGRSHLFLQQVGVAPLDLSADSPADDSQPAVYGNQIAFRSERDDGGIFLMGLTGGPVRRITDFGYNPAWSPDGKEILFGTDRIENPLFRTNPKSQIYRVSLATLQPRLVHAGDAVQPSWSPHGSRIAYWGRRAADRLIWTIPAGGGTPVPVTTGKYVDWNPVWSPDGRYLYFTSDRSGVINLWRVAIDERSGRVLGKPEPVTVSGPAGMMPSISQDGRHIAYAHYETRSILEKVPFDPRTGKVTGRPETITQTTSVIPAFAASPDGRWLVYQTLLPQEDLVLIQSDGTGQRWLTQDQARDRIPRWSPRGDRIAFYSSRGGKYEIWTIHPDGSHRERAVFIPEGQVQHPIWSPDGLSLAIDLDENEAVIDLTLRVAERRPVFLPLPPGQGMGFTASSWSANGLWLAGVLQGQDKTQVPGIVLYSLADKRYVQVIDRGLAPAWLSDSRRLLYWDDEKLFLLDTMSKASRQVSAAPPDFSYDDFCLSANDRVLYQARNTEQGDIWLLTLK